MDICDTVFSNLSRDILNNKLPSLFPVSITPRSLVLTVIPDKISVQICQDLSFSKRTHRISKNIFVYGSYESLEELKG